MPFAAAASVWGITQEWVVLDEELFLAFCVASFGVCAYTAVADSLRQADYEFGLKKWNAIHEQEQQTIDFYYYIGDVFSEWSKVYDYQVVHRKELEAFENMIADKEAIQQQLLLRRGIVRTLNKKIGDVRRIQDVAVTETIRDVHAAFDRHLAADAKLNQKSIESCIAALSSGRTSSDLMAMYVEKAKSEVKAKQAKWVSDGFRPVESLDDVAKAILVDGAKDNLKKMYLDSGLTSYEFSFLYEKGYDAKTIAAEAMKLTPGQGETLKLERRIMAADKVTAMTIFPEGKVPVKPWTFSTSGLH